MTIKFVWNGIKVDGKLYKGFYVKSADDNTITLIAKEYSSLPRIDGLEVKNETDWMTDYFDTDHVKIAPNNKYYAEAMKAYIADEIHNEKVRIKSCEKLMAKTESPRAARMYEELIEQAKERIERLSA